MGKLKFWLMYALLNTGQVTVTYGIMDPFFSNKTKIKEI